MRVDLNVSAVLTALAVKVNMLVAHVLILVRVVTIVIALQLVPVVAKTNSCTTLRAVRVLS